MSSSRYTLGRFPVAGSRAIALAAGLVSVSSCDSALRRLSTTPRTAHEVYAESLRAAGLANTALGREWLAASDSALRTPLVTALPVLELAVYSRSEARAVAYRIALREGQRLRAAVRLDGDGAQLYVDLYEVVADTAQPFQHRATATLEAVSLPAETLVPGAASAPTRAAVAAPRTLAINFEVPRTGTYVVRVQPELLRSGRFEIRVDTEPTLAFPVEGRGNAAIQSFFGAARDGGRRDHHGIDIFAPRGTPALAAADGVVRSIEPNELGGNVVWLADVSRGQSLYYAHLDRHAVSEGQQVRAGDTLGFVGNSGNARTTAPHLHFGIYRRGRGAVDPIDYVRTPSGRAPLITADSTGLGVRAAVRIDRSPIRSGWATAGTILRRVSLGTDVHVMGVTSSWFRIQLDDGTAGYVSAAALRITGERSRDFGPD